MIKPPLIKYLNCIESYMFICCLCIFNCEKSPTEPNRNPAPHIISANITGNGTAFVDSFKFIDGYGTVGINKIRVPAVIYDTTNWASIGYKLFHVIAPEESTLNILYFYSSNDTIKSLYHESFKRPLSFEAASGEYLYGDRVQPDFSLQALKAIPDSQDLVRGIEIDGQTVSLKNGSGRFKYNNIEFEINPFEFVDCRTCPGSYNNGWLEVHCLFSSKAYQSYFGIIYLLGNDTTQIQLGYGIGLEYLDRLDDSFITASWRVADSTKLKKIATNLTKDNTSMFRPFPPFYSHEKP